MTVSASGRHDSDELRPRTPVKHLVDGLEAVPIDIQHITAKLTFDGATS